MKKLMLIIISFAIVLEYRILLDLNHYLALHVFLSAFVAFALLFSGHVTKKKILQRFPFFFAICAFIPGFGFLILLLMYVFWQFIPQPGDEFQYRALEPQEINIEEEQLHSRYGPGGALRSIFNENLPENLRTQALLKVSYAENRNSNKILLDSIKLRSHPVRLLAYSIINAQENALSKKIGVLHRELRSTRNRGKKGRLLKHLGEASWEFSYKCLSEGKQRESLLESAIEFYLSAKALLPEDAYIDYSLGRIYVARKELRTAENYFQSAARLGIDPAIIKPYLAEIQYDEGNYVETRRFLNSLKPYDLTPNLMPVMNMWSMK